jgi:hypothetical protein
MGRGGGARGGDDHEQGGGDQAEDVGLHGHGGDLLHSGVRTTHQQASCLAPCGLLSVKGAPLPRVLRVRG